MAGIRFTEEQQIILSQNANVKKVSEKSITYLEDFKIHAVKKYVKGMSPKQIFKEAGFNINTLGKDIPKQCLRRWHIKYSKQGELGLVGEQRGINSTGRSKSSSSSLEDRLAEAEAKIAYLQMENEFLKKLDALERRLLGED